MKIAVSSYSFSKLMRQNGMTQLDTVKTAAEMGFEGIEFVGIAPHDGSTKTEYALKLREACKEYNLVITNYTVGADFLNGCDGDLDKEIARLKTEIDLAEVLGATSVRHDATIGRGKLTFDDALPRLAQGCTEVTVYAKAKGIRTMVENHGFFAQDSDRLEKLISAVDDENFGLLCDIGNFLCADESPVLAMSRIAKYAFYAHAKDFVIKSGSEANPGKGFFKTRGGNYLKGTIIGHGNVPVVQCISILNSQGYNGFLAIEFEGMEDNIEALSIGLDNLKNYISQAII